jgi:hypothetical protein
MIRMQAPGNTATDQGAVHSACDWVWQGAKLQETVEDLSEAEREAGWCRGRGAATHGIRVATDGKVRPRTLQDHRRHTRQHAGVLHGAAHILSEAGAERIEVVRVVELQRDRWRLKRKQHKSTCTACSLVPLLP